MINSIVCFFFPPPKPRGLVLTVLFPRYLAYYLFVCLLASLHYTLKRDFWHKFHHIRITCFVFFVVVVVVAY